MYLDQPGLMKLWDRIKAVFAPKSHTHQASDVSDVVADVRINGTSITADGVADIPIATFNNKKYGVVMIGGQSTGIHINSTGALELLSAGNQAIYARVKSPVAITPKNFDYAVKTAMCDGKGAAWTVAEQAAARKRMGISDTVSPTANVTKDGSTAIITITDKNGTTTATVSDGAPGADGKSAYQYAQDSGYTGTETEFSKKLASDVMVVKVGQSDGVWSADKTYSDIMNALMSGTSVFVRSSSFFLPFVMSDDYSDKDTYVAFASTSVSNYAGEAGINTNAFMIGKDGRVMNDSSWIDIPTDDHINSLIDAKLGVIENGAY